MDSIQKYIKFVNWPYLLVWSAAVLVIILLIIWLYLNRSKIKLAKYLVPLLIIILMRLILFHNIISWTLYYQSLSWKDVGFRQRAMLQHEIKRFLIKPKKASKFLAVGTSQTGAVYGDYSKENSNFTKIEMPGMGPLDMYLYREYILSYNPDYILLYLSEFDMARVPDLNLAKISPNQDVHLLEIFNELHAISKKYNSETAFKELIIGEFLPEYKYSFIFKALQKKIFPGSGNTLPIFQETDTEELLKQHINGLVAKLNEEEIEINFKFLNKFITYCSTKNTPIIIIEGQYNPLAYNEKTLRLNKIVRNKFKNISISRKNVEFIPRSETIQFNIDDYGDAYHVKGPKRMIFAEQIIKKINSRFSGESEMDTDEK